jgi:hypothetical protein
MEDNKTKNSNQEKKELDPIEVWARAKRLINSFNSRKTVNQYFAGVFRVKVQQVSQAFSVPCRQPGLLEKIDNHINLKSQSQEAA